MSEESTEQFINDINSRIQYFFDEFDLTCAEAIGCLDIIKYILLDDMFEEIDEEEEE